MKYFYAWVLLLVACTGVLAKDAVLLAEAHRAALAGDAVCVLDQPRIQVLIAGRSTMALTADNVIDTVMKGMTLR